MRTRRYRDVIYDAAYLIGIDPTNDLQTDQARQLASFATGRVRQGWEFWTWPELSITEERAFRQVWNSSYSYFANQGEQSEVYYIPTQSYYQAINNPPAGDLPTNATNWLLLDTVEPYVALDQYGKRTITQVWQAYSADPRTTYARLPWSMHPGTQGIVFPLYSGPTVWITYLTRPDEFVADPWSNATAYNRGDLVYDPTGGECYRALAAGTNHALTDTNYWLQQSVPYFLSDYVKYGICADYSDDAQTQASFEARAEEALVREVNRLAEQGEKHYYRRGRVDGYWSMEPLSVAAALSL